LKEERKELDVKFHIELHRLEVDTGNAFSSLSMKEEAVVHADTHVTSRSDSSISAG
jgi:hypothetical protein